MGEGTIIAAVASPTDKIKIIGGYRGIGVGIRVVENVRVAEGG